jgi:hypothetical protein
MTPTQSRFYALLQQSPGGVISADVLALLDDEDDPTPLEAFIRSCRPLFTLRVETDEERETWYHLNPFITPTDTEHAPTDMRLYVPPALHKKAKVKASAEGISLRELVIRALEKEMI